MNFFSIVNPDLNNLSSPVLNSKKDFAFFKFIYQNKPVNGPLCVITLKDAGSMRFRWNEKNMHRDTVLSNISKSISKDKKEFVPVELTHSHIVYDIKNASDIKNLCGDGIITLSKNLIPVVTVADCMPLYLYDNKTKLFGIVHSGWKGTGIIKDAINLAIKNYNSNPKDISVVIGPHIHDCCYIVNEERAFYFRDNFGKECITQIDRSKMNNFPAWDNGDGNLYALSLEKANLYVLNEVGIPKENISVCTDCTCCNELYGSNRRETSQKDTFTVQAAFLIQQTH